MICSLKKIAACTNLVFLLLLSQQLLSMDNLKTDISSNVLSLVIYNEHLDFRHNDICVLAMIDKRNRKAIQDTAKERRKHLKALNPKGCILSLCCAPLTWHEHGSMCTAGAKVWYSHDYSTLQLYHFTYDHNTVNTMCSQEFGYYPVAIKEYPIAF